MVDNNVFINKKTFEVKEKDDNVFICDKKIANSIAELNKKGYKTVSSCEGHIQFKWDEIENCDLSLLKEVEKDKRFIVLDVHENGFDYLTAYRITSIYISFAQKYDFPDLPSGFIKEKYDDGLTIRKTIEYYDNNIKRSIEDLEAEKAKYLQILEQWTKKLPNIN